MPSIKKELKDTSEKIETVSTTTESEEIKLLKEKNASLENKLDQLISLFMASKEKEQATEEKEEEKAYTETVSEEEFPEPSPNKQIRIMSLCYGSLNLAETQGEKARLKFKRYGEVRPCLYSTLLNIVNTNRKFAEQGLFYILDKSAVYHLGLQEDYKGIFSDEVIKNICNYKDVEIKDIISSMNDVQKDTMIRLICDKIYKKNDIDLNKIEIISKIAGVNIMSKVDEMKRIEDARKNQRE